MEKIESGKIKWVYQEIRFLIFYGGFFFMLGYLCGVFEPPHLIKQAYETEVIYQMILKNNTRTEFLWNDLTERLKLKPVPPSPKPQIKEKGGG